MIQNMFVWYFSVLEQFGLIGVTALMAFESSVFPVPSELVIPPAAVIYIKNGHQDGAIILLLAVILAGTLGSLIGASITYWIARAVGRPFIIKYGKYVFIPEHKLKVAEAWVAQYGAGGVFFARLLPVVRHLISIPCGIVGMRFRTFTIMTITGSFLWCSVLAGFGLLMSKDMRTIVAQKGQETPEVIKAFQNLSLTILAMVVIVAVLYFVVVKRKKPAEGLGVEE